MGAQQRTNYGQAQLVLFPLLRKKGARGDVIGEDLYGIVDILRDNKSLLRGLTNPGRPPIDRVALAQDVFGGHVSDEALRVAETVVEQPWLHPRQMVETLEELGLDAYVFTGDLNAKNGDDDLSQQLVDAYTVVANNRDLQIQLSDLGGRDPKERAKLAGAVFDGHVSKVAKRLIMRSITGAHPGHIIQTLRRYAARSAELHGKLLVVCSTARPLTDEQVKRMTELARRKWSHPIALAQVVDPSLIGGFRLDQGEEAIDTTVRTDIAQARLALTA